MSENTAKVNLRINGVIVPFEVPSELEPLYRKAERLLEQRTVELNKQFALRMTPLQVATTVAVEAMLDALKLQNEYEAFQKEIAEFIKALNQNAA